MSPRHRNKLGIAGSGGRGGRFWELKASLAFADYEQVFNESGVNAVLVGTPMPLHVPQAIVALQHGIHIIG